MQEMRGIHTPETETYGFWSFVYKARRPFHPARLHALLNGRWDGVIRSKGFFWLASRMAIAGSVSQAGGMLRHEAAGAWWAAVDRKEWPQDPTWRATIRNSFKSPYATAARKSCSSAREAWTRRRSPSASMVAY
jgi:G3E family GTPase